MTSKSTLFFCTLLLFLTIGIPALSQQNKYGIFEKQTDVGAPAIKGFAVYNTENQEYLLEGAGTNMWFNRDEFNFIWKKLDGDFILRTQAKFLSDEGHPHRKLGLMVRSSLKPDAAYIDAAIHADGLTSMQYRLAQADSTQEKQAQIKAPDVVQLERNGNTFTMSVTASGEPFGDSQSVSLSLDDSVYVGLFVCSHDSSQAARASFRNVRIVKPAPDSLVPYRDYLGSNLEILNLRTGTRRIIHQSTESLQAPNWTPDGKTLIYNKNGLLYKFDLESKTPEVLDTGFADNNNNDHVLSFDGTQIGISHHAEEHDGNSIIYTLPIEGGTPQKVTSQGPSYLHGWSPDANWLTFTGGRNGKYDIYKIPVDGGNEIQLTNTSRLDDGPEYSPDGKFIYFNSDRTGNMEIWRMEPDGSGQEQLTDVRYNNWFPHISPDGSTIIFLSFMPDVDPDDHPFYKQVYLRTMPVNGGEPKVIAYVYGGQGTINVPSWSPDGSRVAFISNTGKLK